MLLDTTPLLPKASDTAAGHRLAEALRERVGELPPQAEPLLAAIGEHSPYLSRLVLQQAESFAQFLRDGPDAALADTLAIFPARGENETEAELMRRLRLAKARLALIVALADLTGQWPLEKVTDALSEGAELALREATRFLLAGLAGKGEIALDDTTNPERGSGLIVLAVGKLGSRELNYSSDIDIIILFDSERARYTGKQSAQSCFSRFATQLVRLMQERTGEGYVFRTDLRLRPDPASTPPALSTAGAMTYYETVGQNWERAALIKARAVAGDIEAGETFLKQLAPFIWRKHLDFAAINDIHSIKRQMDSRERTIARPDSLYGHHIKLGRGGIREIEFFAQIHQLIWGGRLPQLRERGTCVTLNDLAAAGLIDGATSGTLIDAYRFFRRVEHRLQMEDDAQTHRLPASDAGMAHLAAFLGYDNTETFLRELQMRLSDVHAIYADSFKSAAADPLGEAGRLVFTGVEHDPETLATIAGMGFKQPEIVSGAIQGWHHGRRRATRTKRARELITELTPSLLKAFAGTANPDSAFLRFDEFLAVLPAGVQLFSLFQQNPDLLGLIATIMGSAPSLAESLSKNPGLFDAVLSPDFRQSLPAPERLAEQLTALLTGGRDYEDTLLLLRQFRAEKEFQAGLLLLSQRITAEETCAFLSALAECILNRLARDVHAEFARLHGAIPGGRFAVIGMGRLGARELTFGSDIDLIFVFDAPADAPQSPMLYYNRLGQRLITALTSLAAGGRLYAVDMRLRPSGSDGPLVASAEAFDKYFTEAAWTFEFMALTKARPVAGDTSLCEELETVIRRHLLAPKDSEKLIADMMDVRARVQAEFGTEDPWRVKYASGGLMDLDFLAATWLLMHAPTHPALLMPSSRAVFAALREAKLLGDLTATQLIDAARLQNTVLTFLRLCTAGAFEDSKAPEGLSRLLAEACGAGSLPELKTRLVNLQGQVYAMLIGLAKRPGNTQNGVII